MVTPGGRFAVFSAIASLLKAGQEMIVIEPAWPAYKECTRSLVGARSRYLQLHWKISGYLTLTDSKR